MTIVPMEDENGEMEGWVGCATDIEDQKRNESVLIVSEKLAATGRLAASIAHEINNPLEAISNLLYILGSQERLSVEGSRYLSMAEHELMRAAQITKQTLGFYRENSGPAPFSLSDLINEVLVLYQGKLKHKDVVVELSGFDGAQIVATRGEVRQVFANLVGNAIDAVSHSVRSRLRSPSRETTAHPDSRSPSKTTGRASIRRSSTRSSNRSSPRRRALAPAWDSGCAARLSRSTAAALRSAVKATREAACSRCFCLKFARTARTRYWSRKIRLRSWGPRFVATTCGVT